MKIDTQRFSNLSLSKRLPMLVVVLAVGIVGVHFLSASHATAILQVSPLKPAHTYGGGSSNLASIASVTVAQPFIPHNNGIPMPQSALNDCYSYGGTSVQCYTDMYNLIIAARQVDEPSVGPLNINLSQFMALSWQAQYLAIFNAERIQRNLPPLAAETAQLNAVAQIGANEQNDPNIWPLTLNGGAKVGSGSEVWDDASNPLMADYVWMYDDGYGNDSPVDCPTQTAPDCWGHRVGILTDYNNKTLKQFGLTTCSNLNAYLGVAQAPMPAGAFQWLTSDQAQIEGACGPTPTDETVTWQQVLNSGAYTPPPICPSSTLSINQTLSPGHCLVSANGQYELNFSQSSTTGSYLQIINTATGKQLWTSHCGPGYLTMASDGNLVQFVPLGISLFACWSSGTHGQSATQAVLQNNGDLLVETATGAPVWSIDSGFIKDPPSTLYAGQTLYLGNQLFSTDNQYRMVFQTDGNLVVRNPAQAAIFATHTNGQSAIRLIMQPDGNLVIYNTSLQAIWSSGTRGLGGTSVVMQTDGNLVILNAANKPVWSWETGKVPVGPPPLTSVGTTLSAGQSLTDNQYLQSATGGCQLILQDDGNLVVYNASHTATWSAPGSFGQTPGRLTMQGDGNLVLRNASNSVVWAAGTNGLGGTHVVMQGDGNLVILNAAEQPVWSINTGPILPGSAPSSMSTNQSLYANQILLSAAKKYELIYQPDGNLVVYNSLHQAIWDPPGAYGQAPGHLIMQPDGNLVLYNSSGGVVWQTATEGSGATFVAIQDDGNLVIFNGYNQPVWSWETGRLYPPFVPGTAILYTNQTLSINQSLVAYDGSHRLIMQGDGNLVLYNSAWTPTWYTNTEGWVGDRLVLQSDGNLVLYSSANKVLWTPYTEGRGGAYLIMQPDGNLVLYTGENVAVWSIYTGML